MSIATLVRSHARRLVAVGALLTLPVGAAAVVSSTAGASTFTFTASGGVTNPCTSSAESISGPTIITLRSSGSTTLVSAVWEGKTSGGDTFVISGKATVPTSTSSYTIPVQATFAGPTGTFRGTGSATIFHTGSQPTGAHTSLGALTCVSP